MDPLFRTSYSADSPTSADDLFAAINDDRFPKNPQTAADFGFDRLVSDFDKYCLVSLYLGLQNWGVNRHQVHRWQTEGTLIQNIIETYESGPRDCRGQYYPWFLKNMYLFESSKPAMEIKREELFRRVIEYLDPEDQGKDPWSLNPITKSECLLFYGTMSYGALPPPEGPMWLSFGFCVCEDMNEESRLAELYRHLIFGRRFDKEWMTLFKDGDSHKPACTFSEFHAAYVARRDIPQLFRDKKVSPKHSGVLLPRLEQFFTSPEQAGSVWPLKVILAMEEGSQIPEDSELSVSLPRILNTVAQYGLIPSRTPAETSDLKQVYRKLFTNATPVEVHNAFMRRNLFDFASSRINVEPRFKTLMGPGR